MPWRRIQAKTVHPCWSQEEGIELIKQRNKLLVISDKYGWETGVAYMLDPIAEDSDDERRIKKAQKEAKLLKEERKSS